MQIRTMPPFSQIKAKLDADRSQNETSDVRMPNPTQTQKVMTVVYAQKLEH